MRPRVVLSIFDDFENRHYAGGGPAVVRDLAARLALDNDCLVVTAGTRWRRSRRGDVTYLHLPLAWAGPRSAQLLWAAVLPLVALCLRFDVWIESFTPPCSSNLVPFVTRKPVIGLAQALSGREMARRYGTRLPLLLEERLLRHYDDIVVLNPKDRAAVQAVRGDARVHLIPNAVSRPPHAPTSAADGRFALFLGRVDVTQKGLDLLLAVYRDHPPGALLPLVIAGAGVPREEELLRTLLAGAGPHVRWIGDVRGREKERLLQQCAFLVVPSREESFSLAALEAMARGRPVVRFDLPQLSWIPAGAGAVVPPFDTAALGASLQRLSRDVTARAEAGARAAAYAAGHVGPERLDAYRALVTASTGRAARGTPDQGHRPDRANGPRHRAARPTGQPARTGVPRRHGAGR